MASQAQTYAIEVWRFDTMVALVPRAEGVLAYRLHVRKAEVLLAAPQYPRAFPQGNKANAPSHSVAIVPSPTLFQITAVAASDFPPGVAAYVSTRAYGSRLRPISSTVATAAPCPDPVVGVLLCPANSVGNRRDSLQLDGRPSRKLPRSVNSRG